MGSYLGLLLSALTLVNGKPCSHHLSNYAVKEVHNPPRQWTRIGDAPADSLMTMRIGLKMGSWDDFERRLHEVSNPSHPQYGNHLSAEEVNKLSEPKPEVLRSVHSWLATHGYDQDKLEHNPAKDWIKISIKVKDAEKLLDTKYSVYKHEDGTELIRAPQWSIPKDLHQHIVAIQPTNSYLRNSPLKFMHKPTVITPEIQKTFRKIQEVESVQDPNQEYPIDEVCHESAITPTCIRNLYKTINYVPKLLDDPQNVAAFANYLNETSMDSDLQEFLKSYRPEATNVNINFTIINNGTNFQDLKNAPSQELNGEGNLDGQTMVSLVYPLKVKAYNVGGKPPFKADLMTPTNTNEPYLEWLDYMLNNETNLPYVVSTSYGDNEQTVPPDYALKVCEDMAKLGARGVTLLFASGDNGVGQANTCVSNDGRNTTQFTASFPVGCPYVTAVGGTKYVAASTAAEHPEVVAYDPANKYTPGGGFSSYFARPAYQASQVDTYLKGLGDSFKGLFNASGRAYPDVAAISQAYTIFHAGQMVSLDGTSASTPAFASVVSLLVDWRLQNGKKSFGFMNPWLYSVGFDGFFDITNGTAKGCGTEGFPATAGWDAVTGFGSPNFIKLQALALKDALKDGTSP